MSENEEKVENTTSDSTGQDITSEIEVDSSEVKLFTIEELAPSSTPITIPYLEIYRTNELEYVPYLSPYNVGIQSDDAGEDASAEDIEALNGEDEENSSEEGTDTDTDSSSS